MGPYLGEDTQRKEGLGIGTPESWGKEVFSHEQQGSRARKEFETCFFYSLPLSVSHSGVHLHCEL
jgi:hypothetical protein